MNKQQQQVGDLKQNSVFNNINLMDPKKLSTQELEQIVLNNLKSVGEKLQNSSSPIRQIQQTKYQVEQGYVNQKQGYSFQNQKGNNGNYNSVSNDQQQKTLPINRNTPSFQNVIINDSLVGQEQGENVINQHQIQLSAFASPQFNSPSQKLLFSNTNRGETMTRKDLESSNQVALEKKENPQLISNPAPQNNPFQTTDQIAQVQNMLSSIENPFSQNLFASHFKVNGNNNTLSNPASNLPTNLGSSTAQKFQLLPPKQLETPNKPSITGLQQNPFKQDFQKNSSEQSIRNARFLTSNKENSNQNNQSSSTANMSTTNNLMLGDQNFINGVNDQANVLNHSSSTTNQKLRSASPNFNGWSDSTSPAIAGAMKVLKEKCSKAEQQLKELQQTCQQQQEEINQLKENGKTQKQQWEENSKESFIRLSEQTGKVLGEITKLQTENAHVQNENAIMQKQIDAYKSQIQELTQEVLYLRKCNEIIEGEKSKHLEHNAQEKDELDQKFIILEKLRKTDKQLIEKLENDLQELQNAKRIQEEKLKKLEIENEQLKNELYDSQESLEGRCKASESKLSLYEKELNLIKEKYEKERNFNQKRASIYAEKDQVMKQLQEENIDFRSQIKSLQTQLDHQKKQNELHDKMKQKFEREKYSQEESYKQLKGLTDEIVNLAQREANTRMKEQLHLFQQRLKRLDDGNKKISESQSSISRSSSKQKQLKSRGPSKEKKTKDSTDSRANNFSSSKTKSSVISNSANKFYKQASPKSNKSGQNHSNVVTVVSNKKLKPKSKSRNPSQNKELHLEDLDESIESRRSALIGSSSVQKLSNEGQKRMVRKNSLVLSQNNSLDFESMSPHTSRKSNQGQTGRSTSRQRSVSKNSDLSASRNKSLKKKKQGASQISQNSYIYHEDRGVHRHEEDDIDALMTNQSQVTVKPSQQSTSNRYGMQSNNQQYSTILTEPKNPSAYIQSYTFPENFQKMTESEISNEIFKLERAVAETKREYNNLLTRSRENSDINIEEVRQRMNELAIDMQKQSDWQFILKKKQREIITMSFGKQSLQTNNIN
ncbi:hypothetical protein TTHERM_00046690 (macronuclear) [Tetrahymena thermophila SB210]|uniref:Uncharacterized protein n=1 Tax=Tetrahymena thermophila (strain SB210) TaxID=312017 RepID=Q23DM2_TETTS|nr:hypothetical protein TTHERM_00046690 [Tetrahymena thermophila SB210]EAR94635.2 hypothetical protein TTHERM_00046690 [Tetrahymena thermophila SB210]|eukprot:XP_001014664.2 hypothetical protein TTHERM_00046690 [Tetrahymena thermophila SB210]